MWAGIWPHSHPQPELKPEHVMLVRFSCAMVVVVSSVAVSVPDSRFCSFCLAVVVVFVVVATRQFTFVRN